MVLKSRYILVFLVLFLSISCTEKGNGDLGTFQPEQGAESSSVEIYGWSPEVEQSSLYSVLAKGKEVKVIPTNSPHVALFGAGEKVQVNVRFKGEVPSCVTVRPVSMKYEYTYSNGELSIELGPYDKVSVEPDDDTAAPLFIFVNPLEKETLEKARQDDGVLVFSGGRIYDYPNDLSAEGFSGIYIEGGAVIRGSFVHRAASEGLTVSGCGIIDARCNASRTVNGFNLIGAKGFEIRDITVFNNTNWTFRIMNCEDFVVDNVKAVGEMPYNDENDENDAIHLVACRNGEVTRSFGYSWDDAFNVGTDAPTFTGDTFNILVEDCIGWNTMPGNTFTIGWPVTGTAHDIVFRDCVSIHSGTRNGANDRGAIGIHNSGNGTIRDVTLKNIHIEDPQEYGISIYLGFRGSVKEYDVGEIKNITLEDIYMHKTPPMNSRIRGYDAEHPVSGVTFRNIYLGDHKVESLDEDGFLSQEYPSDHYLNVDFEN